MSTVTDRAFNALAQFTGRLSALVEAVKSTPPIRPGITPKALKELLDIA